MNTAPSGENFLIVVDTTLIHGGSTLLPFAIFLKRRIQIIVNFHKIFCLRNSFIFICIAPWECLPAHYDLSEGALVLASVRIIMYLWFHIFPNPYK